MDASNSQTLTLEVDRIELLRGKSGLESWKPIRGEEVTVEEWREMMWAEIDRLSPSLKYLRGFTELWRIVDLKKSQWSVRPGPVHYLLVPEDRHCIEVCRLSTNNPSCLLLSRGGELIHVITKPNLGIVRPGELEIECLRLQNHTLDTLLVGQLQMAGGIHLFVQSFVAGLQLLIATTIREQQESIGRLWALRTRIGRGLKYVAE